MHLPEFYLRALDDWRKQQSDPPVSRALAVQMLTAQTLGLQRPKKPYRPKHPTTAEQDERGECLAQLYCELGSFAAVGREKKISAGRVAQLIRRCERRQ